MKKCVLMLITFAFILASGALLPKKAPVCAATRGPP